MKGDLIEQFVDKVSLEAMSQLLSTEDAAKASSAAIQLANTLTGSGEPFRSIATPAKDDTSSEEKLIASFHNNLVLLIQKTWVEKSDEELKAQVLYQLEEFSKQLESKAYSASYKLFLGIVSDVVYLMFGSMTRTKDFEDYALRIDPEFGIFWWYIKALPQDATWSEEKTRIAILLGMYFLANY